MRRGSTAPGTAPCAALLPPLTKLLDAVAPIIAGFSKWVAQNPQVIATVAGIAVAIGGAGGLLVAIAGVTAILPALTTAFAVLTGRGGAMASIGVGIGLALTYWITISVFAALGTGGLVTPLIAAWAPNMLFGSAAIYLLLMVRT